MPVPLSKIPAFSKHWVYAILALLISFAFVKILDPNVIYRAPVDIRDMAPSLVQSLDFEPRYVRGFKAGEAVPVCPGPDCILNPEAGLDGFTKLQVYPMLDALLNTKVLGGILYYRIHTKVPEFADKSDQIYFDILGVYGRSWKLFVDGRLVGSFAGGNVPEAIALATAGMQPGAPLILGLEFDVGHFMAPGIYQTSQVFLAAPHVATMVRETYRSADLSVVMPIVYAFAGIGLLISLGSFFTPYLIEPVFFSSIVVSWIMRHLTANAVVTWPGFVPQDMAALDCFLKIVLYGSLFCFFNQYFRFKQRWHGKVYVGVLALATIGLYSGALGIPWLAVAVIRGQNLILGLTFGFGAYIAYRSFRATAGKNNSVFRRTILGVSVAVLGVFCAAFLLRQLSMIAPGPWKEVTTSYAMRQVFSTWIHVIVLGMGSTIALEWAMVVLEKQRLMQRFGMVVDRKLLNEITTTERFVSRKCDKVVAMFVDMRAFTAMCDRMQPEPLIETLNTFLTVSTKAVQANGGIVDKLVGDGVMAIWGVPESSSEDVEQALAAVRDIERELATLNVTRMAQGKTVIGYGIGIHCGPAVFGAIGSEDYIDYTATGPAVNLAARIQDMTKSIGSKILVTGSVAELSTSSKQYMKSKGAHRIRGLGNEVEIFAFALDPSDSDAATERLDIKGVA